jgi:NADH:ubiquinone oxidoreductase subunit 3 (subunit A)
MENPYNVLIVFLAVLSVLGIIGILIKPLLKDKKQPAQK